MGEYTYICQQCHNIIKLTKSIETLTHKEKQCPKCKSTKIEELPSWAPIGSTLDEGLPLWEYECQDCHNTFKLPVPSSPSQEKEIKCPECEGRHIHRLTLTGFEPLYCG